MSQEIFHEKVNGGNSVSSYIKPFFENKIKRNNEDHWQRNKIKEVHDELVNLK